jgi:hypothetical protein
MRRRVLEARARQDQEWSGDLARRVDLMMERGEEERVARSGECRRRRRSSLRSR